MDQYKMQLNWTKKHKESEKATSKTKNFCQRVKEYEKRILHESVLIASLVFSSLLYIETYAAFQLFSYYIQENRK